MIMVFMFLWQLNGEERKNNACGYWNSITSLQNVKCANSFGFGREFFSVLILDPLDSSRDTCLELAGSPNCNHLGLVESHWSYSLNMCHLLAHATLLSSDPVIGVFTSSFPSFFFPNRRCHPHNSFNIVLPTETPN